MKILSMAALYVDVDYQMENFACWIYINKLKKQNPEKRSSLSCHLAFAKFCKYTGQFGNWLFWMLEANSVINVL